MYCPTCLNQEYQQMGSRQQYGASFYPCTNSSMGLTPQQQIAATISEMQRMGNCNCQQVGFNPSDLRGLWTADQPTMAPDNSALPLPLQQLMSTNSVRQQVPSSGRIHQFKFQNAWVNFMPCQTNSTLACNDPCAGNLPGMNSNNMGMQNNLGFPGGGQIPVHPMMNSNQNLFNPSTQGDRARGMMPADGWMPGAGKGGCPQFGGPPGGPMGPPGSGPPGPPYGHHGPETSC